MPKLSIPDFLKITEDFYQGALEVANIAFGDYSDGAYMQSMVDMAENLIPDARENHEIELSCDVTGHDIFQHWLNYTSGVVRHED